MKATSTSSWDKLCLYEKARTYWWHIYCTCWKIQHQLGGDRRATKAVSEADVEELREPFANSQPLMTTILWDYLCGDRVEQRLSLSTGSFKAGIKITSVWLWAYFGYQLLNSEMFRVYKLGSQAEQRFTAHEQLEFYQRTSTFFIQLLGEIRSHMSDQTCGTLELERLEGLSYVQFGRSLIYLLSEYFHIDLMMPRVLDVERHLHQAILSDALWYLMRERYRDHIFHVIDVCLLGSFLLHCRFPDGMALWEFITRPATPPLETFNQVLQNWFLAALFHDIGYSIQLDEQKRLAYQRKTTVSELGPIQSQFEWELNKLNELLRMHRRTLMELELQKAKSGIHVPISVIHEIDAVQQEIHHVESQLETLYIHRTGPTVLDTTGTQRLEDEDHGLLGKRYVKRLLESAADDTRSLVENFKPALRAISKHNMMDKTISLAQDPLAVLLVLCDELQEWGRARVDVSELGEWMVSTVLFPQAGILPTNRLLDCLYLGVNLDETSRCGILPKGELKFVLRYKDATTGQFEPLAIWLLKSYNFQRLEIQDELKISVVMHNPLCMDLQQVDSMDACEFNVLRDFMRDRRKWQDLKDWLESTDAIHWEITRDVSSDGRTTISDEKVILSLNRLSGKRPLHHEPSVFFPELFQWRREYVGGKRRVL